MDWFLIVLAAICYIWAFLFILLAGEKYMAWTLDREHPERYDLKRFKIVYATALTVLGTISLYQGINDSYSLTSVFFLAVIAMWILFYTWCRKKEDK